MSPLDISIVVAYFVMTIATGFYCHREASQSVRSYFLANNEQPWWMLAVSGAATRCSLEGPIWNVAMLIGLGMVATHSLYMAPVYCMGKWIPETIICIGVFAACSAALYFTWFKSLLKHTPIFQQALKTLPND